MKSKEISKFLMNKICRLMFLTIAVGLCLNVNPSEAKAQTRQKTSKQKTVKEINPKSYTTAKKAEKDKVRKKKDERPAVIVRNGKKIVLDEEEGLKRFDQPSERQQWFLQKRLAAGMREIPMERYMIAREKIKEMKRYSTADGRMFPSEKAAPNLKEGGILSKEDTASAGETSGVLGTWTPLGPGNVGGRTRALIINPTDPNIMYAGAVAGGVWKTTDGGTTWTVLDDFLANIAVSTLVFDPANPNTIYAGTGEGFFNADGVRGAGIFRSTDAGATWTQLASTTTADFFYVQDIVVSPNNSQNIYAATRSGVMRSLDGGATWTNVLVSNAANGLNGAMDLVIRTDQATDYIFASVGSFAQAHIWRNTDAAGAGTWVDVYTEASMGRTSLALAPSNQSIIYAMATSIAAGSYNNGLLAVIRSTSNGDSGSWADRVRNNSVNKQDTLLLSNPVNGALTECGFGTTQFLNQGWYDNVIAVDPTDSDKVWVGGVDLFRSDNGGTNWGVASYWWFQGNGTPPANGDPQLVHADNHAIVFHPNYNGTTNQTMFAGNDGGVYKTVNAKDGNVGYVNGTTPSGGTITNTSPICGNGSPTFPSPVTWSPLNNGYEVTQFYHGLPYPNGQTFFGGTQDNGTNRGTIGGGANAWERIFGGDGGYVAVNPANTQVIYAETTGLSIRRSDNGGASFTLKTTGISDAFPFITVFQMDPTTPTRLWIGGRYLWRTDNSGDAWTRTSATQQTGGSITAIAIAPTNSDIVMSGAASGQLRRITSGLTANATTPLTSWLQSFTPRGNGFGVVSWIAYDPTNANNVWVTFSTFNSSTSGNGFGHVFKSTDGGATWVLADGNQTVGNVNAIPDIPVHSVVVDPNNTQRIYVGTDLGVFVSLDGGANWAKETTGFSNVVVESLSILNNGGVSSLYAFTHGRSAFKVTIPASCVTVSPLTQNLSHLGQAGTVTVTKNVGATASCDWNSVSNSSFITLDSVSLAGTDSGTLNFTIAANPVSMPRSGTITVAGTTVTVNQAAAPTAATATLGGRVVDTRNNGISRAIVTVTLPNGQTRNATTNIFGNFQFDDLEVGNAYTISVKHKQYQFQTQVINLDDNVKDLVISPSK